MNTGLSDVVGLISCRYSGWDSASMGGLRVEPEGGFV